MLRMTPDFKPALARSSYLDQEVELGSDYFGSKVVEKGEDGQGKFIVFCASEFQDKCRKCVKKGVCPPTRRKK